MRLSEILKEEQSSERVRCVTCDGLGKELVGDDQLVFDCPDCKGEGYFDQVEERKVTQTMAGKQQKPSRKLAMDRKKKSPNQGKPPVELKKSTKCVKNLSDEIVKGEHTTGKLASQKH